MVYSVKLRSGVERKMKKVDWKKEYFKAHKLLGRELTPLLTNSVYVNKAGNKIYLEITKKTGKNEYSFLGYVSFSTKQFCTWLSNSIERVDWESHKEDILERKRNAV